MQTESAQERVARGAAWLDEQKPGWRNLVDPFTLKMDSQNLCTAGQVFREEAIEYWADADYSNDGFVYANEVLGVNPETHGFDASFHIMTYTELMRDYEALRKEWLRVLS